jgi:hypothetical protein
LNFNNSAERNDIGYMPHTHRIAIYAGKDNNSEKKDIMLKH